MFNLTVGVTDRVYMERYWSQRMACGFLNPLFMLFIEFVIHQFEFTMYF